MSQDTDEPLDKVILDTRDEQCVPELSEIHYTSYNDWLCDTWKLYTDGEGLENDSMHSKATVWMKNPCCENHHRDYIDKIKEFQIYLDTVKKIIRPGCSKEMLDAALNSISSLVETLSVISSKQIISASL